MFKLALGSHTPRLVLLVELPRTTDTRQKHGTLWEGDLPRWDERPNRAIAVFLRSRSRTFNVRPSTSQRRRLTEVTQSPSGDSDDSGDSQ